MNWKRATLNDISHGKIVKATGNMTVSSHGNLIDPKGVYKTFDGGSVALIQKGSLGVVSDNKIHIVSSPYLKENIDKIENGAKLPAFNHLEMGSLLKDTTHIISINFHVLNNFETLTV